VAYGLASAYSIRALRVSQYVRYITFLFVDQSSSRLLYKFAEDIPTSVVVIEAQTLNFKLNFKFSRLIFLGRPPSQLGCALGSLGQSL